MAPALHIGQLVDILYSVLYELLEFPVRLDLIERCGAVSPAEGFFYAQHLSKASCTEENKRATISAASSSSLGMLIGEDGVTLLVDATRLVLWPSSVLMHR